MTALTADRHSLPAGWRWVRLGELISEAQPGFACGERDLNGIIQLRMNNVDTRGNLVWNEFIRVPADTGTLAKYLLVDGDVVFNNTNSTALVGKTALFWGHIEPVVYSNHFTRLRARTDRLDQSYLASWLQFQWRSKVFEELCNQWIGQSAVKNDKLLALDIPLPPLPEQRRIAAILNEQMAAIDRARAAAEAQLAAARDLPAAYLREVFESKEADGWPMRRLGDVCDIRLGKMLSPVSKTGTHERPYLRNANVQWGRFDLSDVATMDFTEVEELKLALKPGDLMVCEGGEPGRAAVWQGEIVPCYYQKALHRLRPVGNLVIPEYVMYRLWAGALRGEFIESHAQTTIAHLPAIRLRELRIRIPPIALQRQIISELGVSHERATTLEGVLIEQTSSIGHLPAALLRQAFSGEL